MDEEGGTRSGVASSGEGEVEDTDEDEDEDEDVGVEVEVEVGVVVVVVVVSFATLPEIARWSNNRGIILAAHLHVGISACATSMLVPLSMIVGTFCTTALV